jgi:fucose 4-O-acetylase-like acetyltransferase
VRSLGLPYVTWLLAIGAFLSTWYLIKGHPVAWLPGAMVWGGDRLGRPFSAFWFVTALLFACLLYRLAERIPWRWRGLAVGAALTAAYLIGPDVAHVPLSAGVAVPCVAFLFAGDALRRYRSRVRSPLLVGGLLMFVGGMVFAAQLGPTLNLKGGTFGVPYVGFDWAFAISAGLILVCVSLAERLPGWTRAAVVELASVGLVVVLTHSLVLRVLRGYDEPHLVFAIAVVLPWAAGLLLARTRLAVLTVGSGPPLMRLRRLPVRAAIPGHRTAS